MKKKLVLAILCLVVSFSTMACGSSIDTTINTSDLSVEELQKLVEELQIENEKLSQKIEKLTKTENKKSETWADDYVIEFADAGFEKYIRKAIGRLGGDICYKDVKGIKRIHIDIFDMGISFNSVGEQNFDELSEMYEDEWIELQPLAKENYDDYSGSIFDISSKTITCINSLEDLKYFTGLEYLYISGVYEEVVAPVTNVCFMEKLENLQYIYLPDSKIYSLEGIEGCVNLKELTICSAGIQDYRRLGELKNLTSVEIIYGDIEEIEKYVDKNIVIDNY